jgi:hypothetical protein
VTELTTGKYFAWNPGCEPCVLLEEFIDGDEFDVDVLLWDDECVYVNVIDNWPTVGLGFLETGSNCPTVYPDNKAQQVCMKVLRDGASLWPQHKLHALCKRSMGRCIMAVGR